MKNQDKKQDHYTRGYQDALFLSRDGLLDIADCSTEPFPAGGDAAAWAAWMDSDPWRSVEQIETDLRRAPAEIRDPDHDAFTIYSYWRGVRDGLRERRLRRGQLGRLEQETSQALIAQRMAGRSPGDAVLAVAEAREAKK